VALIWSESPKPAQPAKPSAWTRCWYCGGRGKVTVTWNGDEDECFECEGAGGFGPVKKEAS